MIDQILMFVAGMILGGFVLVKAEEIYFAKKFPTQEPSDEVRIEHLKKLSFIESFISVFIATLAYFYFQHYFIYGACLGAFIFSRKPNL